ncbi:NAD(P)/FAD-dependent oxidoreductase [Devosia sp. CN2-171]|uniref:NAD(P)/FAD-dependent oxidoreductase n=1 Tax=Devosia sp. CN2-171 TaxID=3400909 RepID=UPI003BF925EC
MLHDAIIVGGSFAGLAAATYIARGRRTAAIIDTGLPRNRFAAHSHGFLTHDGNAPAEILATARAQVAAYPTVQFIDGSANSATKTGDGFAVTLGTGEVVEARKLVLAYGISDILPEIPGLKERWGNSVIHCPYCHGYEFSDRQLGVLNMQLRSSHQAQLIAEWGPTTFFLNGETIDDATRTMLEKRGVAIEPTPVKSLHGDGKHLSGVELIDGRTVGIEALYIGAPTRHNSSIAIDLGCDTEESPAGPVIKVDGMKMTTVPGVYAAGDITRAMHNVTFAVADGVMAGVAIHASLVY